MESAAPHGVEEETSGRVILRAESRPAGEALSGETEAMGRYPSQPSVKGTPTVSVC